MQILDNSLTTVFYWLKEYLCLVNLGTKRKDVWFFYCSITMNSDAQIAPTTIFVLCSVYYFNYSKIKLYTYHMMSNCLKLHILNISENS